MSRLRIVGGRFKGRRLEAPKGLKTRPTGQRVREALFNILGASVLDATVADCFAGSGALGFEAISRGALHVDFFERDREPCRVITQNIRDLHIADQAQVVGGSLPASLKRGSRYDLVLMDPPWGKGLAERTLETLAKHRRMNLACQVVVEERRGTFVMPERLDGYVMNGLERRTYGDTELTLFRVMSLEEPSFDSAAK